MDKRPIFIHFETVHSSFPCGGIYMKTALRIIFFTIVMFICEITLPDGNKITIPPVKKLVELCDILNLKYHTIKHISMGYYKGDTPKPRRIRHYLSSINIQKQD